METKKLTSQESLELITEMMQNTKQNLSNRSGNTLLIWGATSFGVALLIILLRLFVLNSPLLNWLFMLIPVLGTIWGRVAVGDRAKVYTQVDKMVKQLWQIIMIVAIAIPLLFTLLVVGKVDMLDAYVGNRLFMLIPFLEVLVVSTGLAITGAVIDFKACKVGGLVGVVLSVLSLMANIPLGGAYFMFLLWPVVSMIIPGLKLNAFIKSRKDV